MTTIMHLMRHHHWSFALMANPIWLINLKKSSKAPRLSWLILYVVYYLWSSWGRPHLGKSLKFWNVLRMYKPVKRERERHAAHGGIQTLSTEIYIYIYIYIYIKPTSRGKGCTLMTIKLIIKLNYAFHPFSWSDSLNLCMSTWNIYAFCHMSHPTSVFFTSSIIAWLFL
jgi:hypothetical protein